MKHFLFLMFLTLWGASPTFAQNLMAGWDGNGAGTEADKPGDFGWACTDASIVWATASNSNDTYAYRYRDNLSGVGRVLTHPQNNAVFSFPLRLTAGKFYKFHCGDTNMNHDDVNTVFGVNTKSDATGTMMGQKQITAPKWENTSTVEFIFQAVSSDTCYMVWYTLNGTDRNIAYDFSVTEIAEPQSVTFDTGGNGEIAPQYFETGTTYTVEKPANPTKEGYDFVGWFTDAELTQAFDFSTPVSASITLYARFDVQKFNYIDAWDGNGQGTESDKPDDFGWSCTDPNVTWSTASNSNGTYDYRYRDNLTDVGRVLTHPLNDAVFSFPTTLTGGKVYKFSCMNSNFNGSPTAVLGINTQRDFTGDTLAITSLTSPRWPDYTTVSFLFGVPEDGTYYFVWHTVSGHDRNFVGSLSITEADNAATVSFDTQGGSAVRPQYFTAGESYTITVPANPAKEGYEFGGWYADSTFTQLFDFTKPVTASTTVYARFVSLENPTYTSLAVENENLTMTSAPYMHITVSGKSELHLTATDPLKGSDVNLHGNDAWLFLEGVRHSEVLSGYTSVIKIDDRNLNPDVDRISIYGSGAVIIPNGKANESTALQVYKEENLSGDALSIEPGKYYRSEELGTFDNAIRSFKLSRGYACTLANNPDGTGYSRVFIASDSDVVVNSMPEGLEFASFVRVFRWQWIGKKGICNGSLADITRSSWYYDWSAGGESTDDFEFVPMRHNLGWDSFSKINAKQNVTHVLGFNEPDHTDQANCTPEQAIAQWPELFKSGLRLGSPAPDAIRKDWLRRFLALADSLNYRVDFVAAHMYWNSQTGQGLYDGITSACRDLYDGRPMWITEMNNGANWTTESWPTASGTKLDADFNPILDADGNTLTDNRPYSPENAEKQLAWMKDVLDGLQRCPYLERHAMYNWVQDARAVVLNGKLTLAGEYFAKFNSAPGFTKAREYVHTWHIAPPFPQLTLTDDYKANVLSWYDHNGETGKNYIIERMLDGDTEFQPIDTLSLGTDYEAGATVTFTDSIEGKGAQYRIRATSYKDSLSIYSRILTFNIDSVVGTPQPVTGEALSTTLIHLSWTAVANARAYNLERATSADGPYETIASLLNATEFTDSNLTAHTTYYYRLSAVNNHNESEYSTPTAISTLELTKPQAPANANVSSGDNRATLVWDFQYDAAYRVLRSTDENGNYEVLADSLNTTKFVDTTANNGTTYYYEVVAYNEMGETATDPLTATPTRGRWAYWSMDEAGDTIYDAWGGFHGKRYNNATAAEGKTNNGTAFQASDKAYVQVGNDLLTGLHDFTIAFWAKTETKGSRFFDFGESTSSFMILSPALRYKITCPAGTYDITVPDASVPLDEWTHIAITQKENEFCIYLNGEQVFTDSTNQVYPQDMGTNTRNYLVRSQWTSDSYSSMTLDEMYIFNYALDSTDISRVASGQFDEIALGIGSVANNEVSVFFKGDALYVSSPSAERICIYDLTGRMLHSDTKAAGSATLRMAHPLQGIVIVKGSSGWARKVAIR
jgi:uncharacterized repeat protein (TIGR02543 family)